MKLWYFKLNNCSIKYNIIKKVIVIKLIIKILNSLNLSLYKAKVIIITISDNIQPKVQFIINPLVNWWFLVLNNKRYKKYKYNVGA